VNPAYINLFAKKACEELTTAQEKYLNKKEDFFFSTHYWKKRGLLELLLYDLWRKKKFIQIFPLPVPLKNQLTSF